jgi:hypothetical protein
MSGGWFTPARATQLVASGCVGIHGRSSPCTVNVSEGGVLACTDGSFSQFRISVDIKAVLQAPDADWLVASSHVQCTSAEGRSVECEGTLDPYSGNLRVCATTRQHAYFWFEVRPRAI